MVVLVVLVPVTEAAAAAGSFSVADANPAGVSMRASKPTGAIDDAAANGGVASGIDGDPLDKGQRARTAVGYVAREHLADPAGHRSGCRVLIPGECPGRRSSPCSRPFARAGAGEVAGARIEADDVVN